MAISAFIIIIVLKCIEVAITLYEVLQNQIGQRFGQIMMLFVRFVGT